MSSKLFKQQSSIRNKIMIPFMVIIAIIAIASIIISVVTLSNLMYSHTDQSRATHPVWEYRDLEQVDWWPMILNPQENVCKPFHNNLNTRLLEKDYWKPCVPNPGLR